MSGRYKLFRWGISNDAKYVVNYNISGQEPRLKEQSKSTGLKD